MDEHAFMLAAKTVGVSKSPLYLVIPDKLAGDLLDAAKRYARALEKKVPGLKHSAALEVIAKAVGNEHWHAFHTKLNFLIEHYTSPQIGQRKPLDLNHISPLVPALVLLSPAGMDLAPSPEALHGMRTLASQIVGKLPLSEDEVLDAISTVHGADSWESLSNRRPEASKDPLYAFASKGGGFEWSPACAAMVEEQDKLFQGYEDRPRDQQKKCLAQVRRTLKMRPDFLEGYLALGTILRFEGQDEEAGKAYEAGIERAEALIPQDFNGEISWSDMDNRFYHRLLYAQMEWSADYGRIPPAIKLAKKQLQRNLDDNLGIRFYLPLLLCANGQYAEAEKAAARYVENDDGQSLFVRSVCALLVGKSQDGNAAFLHALFVMPQLRFLVFNQEMTNVDHENSRRPLIPDLGQVWSGKMVVVERVPELDQHFRKLLQMPSLIAEELRLAHLFRREWNDRDAAAKRTWIDETKATATSLATEMPAFSLRSAPAD